MNGHAEQGVHRLTLHHQVQDDDQSTSVVGAL